ncbi:tRNA guanosine(15) transglycosylase TgtA [Methanopyrus sp. KOL6]|uniref:tRNA guanosine(15) transglycosylase TgtA n=1 Tax=Methanopyrus sp. KOL6 TaxID=1937004 RepID=UPI0012FA927A|nr:tRNA guanosine(15) transglycosylase TgtA [Methanopyrus sp. KOL6]
MNVTFEVKDRDVAGRLGRFEVNGRRLKTPALLPVVNPNKPTLKPREISKLGFDGVITNAYIIRKHKHLREKALEKGVHGLLGFDGFVMTDSGSFQLAEYGDVEVSNEEIVRFQAKIGSDVGTILDVPTPPDAPRSRVERDLETTLKRAREAVELDERPPLAFTVQGSTYEDLRRLCAEKLAELPAAVYPVGGVVPLLEEYRFVDVVRVVLAAKSSLPPHRPVHLFGCGHPLAIPLAVAMGCDLFDSASYAIYARSDRYMSILGTLKLEELETFPCSCPVCTRHDPDDVREMKPRERTRVLATHNLYELRRVIETTRQAIVSGELWELSESVCRAHPRAWAGMVELARRGGELERWCPAAKRSVFVCDEVSKGRPELWLYRRRLRDRFGELSGRKVVKGISRPYAEIVEWLEPWELAFADEWLGVVPGELSWSYPCHCLVEPSGDDEGEDRRRGEEGRRR